jgi:hypothetical protein
MAIDIASIMRRAEVAANAVFDAVEVAAPEAIKLQRYVWPRTTVRSTGAVVTSPRDKYDTGNLYRQQRLERQGKAKVSLVNDADYALDVYVGIGSNPGSPWLKEAITAISSGSIAWQNPRALCNPSEVFKNAFARSI